MPHFTDPVITPRLILRCPEFSDADGLMQAFGDPEVMKYIGDGSVRPREVVLERIALWREMFSRNGQGQRTVIERATGAIVGDCGVFPIARVGPETEIGYRFRRASWGMGYATEAASAMLAHAMKPAPEGLGIRRICALTDLRNDASQRVLLKIGLHRAGTTDKYYNETLAFFQSGPPETSAR